MVLTFSEYNACNRWPSNVTALACASMSKCYGRRLVLELADCAHLQQQSLSDMKTWLSPFFDGLLSLENDSMVLGGSLSTHPIRRSEEYSMVYYGSDAAASVPSMSLGDNPAVAYSDVGDPTPDQNNTMVNGVSMPVQTDPYAVGLLDSYNAAAASSNATTQSNASSNSPYKNPHNMHQWNFDLLGVEAHWDMWGGMGNSHVVAVLDSGVAASAEPAFRHLLDGYDFVSDPSIALDGDGRDHNSSDPGDMHEGECETSSWHGTYVASVLAATEQQGFSGVAPRSVVLPVRVLGKCKMGYASDVADAIAWSIGANVNGIESNTANGAQTIVMAFAGVGSCPSYLQSVITLAAETFRVRLYASAGNDGRDASEYFPANCKHVVSIGALDKFSQQTFYTSRNAQMYMPGGTQEDPVPCMGPDLQVSGCIGTSVATPHAAGLHAIMNSLRAEAARSDVEYVPGYSNDTEAGIVRATTYMGIIGPISRVVAGNSHTCAILSNSSIKCWGHNDGGQLGLGDVNNRGDNPDEMGNNLPIVNVGNGRAVRDLCIGEGRTCALLDNNCMKCWGKEEHGALGYPRDSNNRGDSPFEMGDNLTCIPIQSWSPYANTIANIACGSFHTCLLYTDGRVRCFGASWNGEIPHNAWSAAGVDLGTNLIATQISCGPSVCCVVLNNSGVKCWGYNGYGQLGYGDKTNRGSSAGSLRNNLPFVDLGVGNTVRKVHIGPSTSHACAVLTNGKVKCWGYNFQGQLGYGDTNDRGDAPNEMGSNLGFVDLGTGVGAIDVQTGYMETCAITDSQNRIKCWGRVYDGALGYGDGSWWSNDHRGDAPNEMGNNLGFVNMGSVTNYTIQLAKGGAYTCALQSNYYFKCWGNAQFGRTGNVPNTLTVGLIVNTMGDNLAFVDVGTTVAPVGLQCAAGTFYSLQSFSCIACLPWTYSNGSDPLSCKACSTCPAGKYISTYCNTTSDNTCSFVGPVACYMCQSGTYAAEAGSMACTPCPPGTFCPDNQSVTCTPCPEGSYTSVSGSSSCTQCPSGSATKITS